MPYRCGLRVAIVCLFICSCVARRERASYSNGRRFQQIVDAARSISKVDQGFANLEVHRATLDVDRHLSVTDLLQASTRHQMVGSTSDFSTLPHDMCPPTVHWEEVFTKKKYLANGTFGIVWTAQKKGDETERFAVKFVKSSKFFPGEILPMRKRLPFVADLDSLYHHSGDEHELAIVTPLYKGGDLRQISALAKHLQSAQVKNIAAQIAYGIWQMHRQGWLWGDMKLPNVFVDEGAAWLDEASQTAGWVPKVVIADFGTITVQCGPSACTDIRAGSPWTRPPSIFLNKPYGLEVDWWAFGVSIGEILASHPYVYPCDRDPNCTQRWLNAPGGFGAELKGRIIAGEPWASREEIQLNRPEFAELKVFLEKLVSGPRFSANFENPQARRAMQTDDPANHPILSDPYWRSTETEWNREAINSFWLDICQRYSPSKCNLAPTSITEGLSSICHHCAYSECKFSSVRKYSAVTAREKLQSVCNKTMDFVSARRIFSTIHLTEKACKDAFHFNIGRSPRLSCCKCLALCPHCRDEVCDDLYRD